MRMPRPAGGGAGRLSGPARRNENSGRCSSLTPFCPRGTRMTNPGSVAQCSGAFLYSDAKEPENKRFLFSGPDRVGIHTDTSQFNCGLTPSAEKRMLPDRLTFWLSLDRQGVVSPTPSPVLPNLLRPEIQGYCSMAERAKIGGGVPP